MKNLGITAAAALLFVALGYGYGAERKEFVATVGADGTQRVEVLAGSYYFDPNYIVVKVNVPVVLVVRKESGVTPHDIVVKAPDAGIDFDESLSTEPKEIKFTPTKAGMYPFYCSKKFLWLKHREKGMEGTLEARE